MKFTTISHKSEVKTLERKLNKLQFLIDWEEQSAAPRAEYIRLLKAAFNAHLRTLDTVKRLAEMEKTFL